MPSSRLTAPLRIRTYVLLLSGRTVSMVGNAVAPIALAFAVLRLTGSAGDLGLVMAARTVTQVLLLLFGGVIADRFPRRAVLVGCAALAGLSQATAAALLLTGVARVGQLAAIEAVNGAAAALLFPASQSALPQTVPAEALQQANVYFRLGRNGTTILGGALGGAAVAVIGTGWAIAFDAATFAVAALLWTGMRLAPAREGDAPSPSMLRELIAGWHDFRSRTWLWTIVVQFAFCNAAYSAGFAVLGPMAARAHLDGAGPWGLVVAANGAGLAAGSVIMTVLRARRPLLLGNTGVLMPVAGLAALALGFPLAWQIVVAVVSGIGSETFGVNWDLTMQREIPGDRLGRLYSYDAVGSFVVMPIGQALAGPAQELLGLSGALWAAAGIIAVATLPIYAVRDVWTVRAPA